MRLGDQDDTAGPSPPGWAITPAAATRIARVPAGGKVTAAHKVAVPGTALQGDNVLTAHADYAWNGHAAGVTASFNAVVPAAAPPASNAYTGDLQWNGTANGRRPVERDHSNGENAWGGMINGEMILDS